MTIAIPEYNKQISIAPAQSPQANAPQPQEGAYGGNLLEAANNIQRGFDNLANVSENIAQKQQQIKADNFTATLKQDRDDFLNKLENSNDYANFAADYDKFNSQSADKGVAALGVSGYERWRNNGGSVLMEGIKLESAQKATTKQINESQAQLADTLNKNALSAAQSKDPQTVALYFADAQKQINNAYLPQKEGDLAIINPEQKLNLENNFKLKFSEASQDAINAMLQNNDMAGARNKLDNFKNYMLPKTYNTLNAAIGKQEVTSQILQNPLATAKKLQNQSNFTFLLPSERESLLHEALTLHKSREDTILDQNTKNLTAVFEGIYDKNPQTADMFYKNILNNRGAALQKYGLSPEKLNVGISFMQNVLNNPNSETAIQNEYAWAQAKTNYKMFDLQSDFTVKNPSLNNVESLTNQIGVINGNIMQGNFDAHKDEALEMVSNLRKALAVQVNDSPKIMDKGGFFSNSVSESLPKQIKTFISERVTGGQVAPEALGQIYEDVYKTILTTNINLKSTSSEDKAAAGEIVRNVITKDISNQYMLAPDEANSVATAQGTLINHNANAQPAAKTKLRGYNRIDTPSILNPINPNDIKAKYKTRGQQWTKTKTIL